MESDLLRRIDELERQAAESEMLGGLSHHPDLRAKSRELAKHIRELAKELKAELTRDRKVHF